MNTPIEIPTSALVPSKTNRKSFDGEKLKELADNIKTVGLLQPPLVRPIKAGPAGEDRYEIVYGERRWRACKLAGLEQIPCTVRELTDRQAAEIQMVENLQREDVDMVEEAQILQRMLDLEENGNRVYNAASLAVRLGKSKGYVSHRLHLVHLPRKAKDALRSGKLQPTTAELIGRLPKTGPRESVTTAVLELGLTFQATKELIQREYMRSLKSAPFSRECAELCPNAGSCDVCPKRTGNMDLDNVKDGWVCCDPDCYAEKAEAAWQRQTAAAREAGLEVLSDEESRRIFPDGRNLAYDAPYVILTARPPEDIIKPDVIWRDLESWVKMLGDAVPAVLARVPDTGRSVELAKLEHCLTAAVEQGHGELFKDTILRRYGAAAPAGSTRIGGETPEVSGLKIEPTKAEKTQRDAQRETVELKAEVAAYFQDRPSIFPGDLPLYAWKLFLQAAVINSGAQARKQVSAWYQLSEEDIDARLHGKADVDYEDIPLELLAWMVAEWSYSHQKTFIGQLLEYVSEEQAQPGDDALAAESEMPSKYRPAALTLPDAEVTCEVYCLDGSEAIALLGMDDEDNEVWVNNDSGAPLEKIVVGWEYYEGEEEESA